MDAVLVTGDIFDTGATPSDARELFSDLVVKLHRAGVALLLLGGSHVEAMKERIDPLVVALLNRLASTQLSEHFRVVGNHALYAYEAAAGVRLEADALATRDIDLLWDTRKRITFSTQLARVDSSMLGVLKKVDPTFRMRQGQKYTAVNKDGFEVDMGLVMGWSGECGKGKKPGALSRRGAKGCQVRGGFCAAGHCNPPVATGTCQAIPPLPCKRAFTCQALSDLSDRPPRARRRAQTGDRPRRAQLRGAVPLHRCPGHGVRAGRAQPA